MQSIQNLLLSLALAAMATALPTAAAPAPAPTAPAVFSDAIAPRAFINARGATVQEFAAACTVGDDALATCTGAVAATVQLVGRTVMATVQATVQAASAQATEAVSVTLFSPSPSPGPVRVGLSTDLEQAS